MSIFTGQWTGTISGTNTGRFLLDITDNNEALSGNVVLSDDSNGLATFDFLGNAKDGKVELDLTPKQFPKDLEMGRLKVKGELQPDGSLSGVWESTIGSEGTFLAFKTYRILSASAASASANSPAAVSINHWYFGIASCICAMGCFRPALIKRYFKQKTLCGEISLLLSCC